MTTATTQTFEPDGRAIPFADDGEGPVAVVLLPGWGMSIAALDTLAADLVEMGHRILSVGVRRASDTEPAATLHDLAQDVVDVMDHVGLADAWIGGHAFGGAIARTVAHDHHDRTDGVLLLGVEGIEPLPEAAADALRVAHAGAGGPEALEVMHVLAGPGVDPQFAWNVFAPARDADAEPVQLAALAATPAAEWAPLAEGLPALIIQGTQDRITVPENATRLQSNASNRATLVPIEGAGYLMVLTHPGQLAFQIEDYLAWD